MRDIYGEGAHTVSSFAVNSFPTKPHEKWWRGYQRRLLASTTTSKASIAIVSNCVYWSCLHIIYLINDASVLYIASGSFYCLGRATLEEKICSLLIRHDVVCTIVFHKVKTPTCKADDISILEHADSLGSW